MRRFSLITLLLMLMLLPSLAAAQAEVSLQTLQVQLWPEYDQPAMLVIYDFSLPEDTLFPVDVNVRIPAGAQLLAVARHEADNLMQISYNGPTRDGKWDVLSIAVEKAAIYRVEYYAPLIKHGGSRSYEYRWTGDYAVKQFELILQQPIGSQAVVTTPAASSVAPSGDGLVYHSYVIADLPAGQEFNWLIAYQKDSDDLSISAMGVQPVAPLNVNVNNSNMLMENLPLVLGILGVVLILGSAIWYWLAGRAGSLRGSTRSPKRSRGKQVVGEDSEIYCSQCGKRAQGGDRFCRSCGSRLRVSD